MEAHVWAYLRSGPFFIHIFYTLLRVYVYRQDLPIFHLMNTAEILWVQQDYKFVSSAGPSGTS